MITDTEAYKGRKFICKECGYVVSSDATDDFDVYDFSYCPYCGQHENGIPEWDRFCSFLENTMGHFRAMKTWSDKDKLSEAIRAIEKEICRIRKDGA